MSQAPVNRYLDAYEQGYPGRKFLWDCMEEALTEPHTTISHTAMPSWEEHVEWLARRTQRVLLIIEAVPPRGMVGFVSLTENNEIGIRLLKQARGQGYGRQAIEHLLRSYKPLPGIPSVRPSTFVANINPRNTASIALFTGLGARHIQNTYQL